MGLGMGGTMMPIMTSALQTLKDHEIARGSTLMNITQQVAASIGTALFSVLLTNGFNSSAAVGQLRAALATPEGLRLADRPGGRCRRRWPTWRDAFGDVFVVGHGAGRALPGPGAAAAAQPAKPAAGRRPAGAPALTRRRARPMYARLTPLERWGCDCHRHAR